MLTLLVNGVPAIKLRRKSEIPPRRGSEPWQVIDAHGKTVASYLPADSHFWPLVGTQARQAARLHS